MVRRGAACLGVLIFLFLSSATLAREWLRARDVSTEQRWIPDPASLRPGDRGLREVTVTARGVEAPRLPDHFLTVSTGLHQELAEAHFATSPDGEGEMTLTAVFRFRFRVDAPAEIDVQPIYFPWESRDTGEQRLSAAAPRQITPAPRSRAEALADARSGRGALAEAMDWADARRARIAVAGGVVVIAALALAGVALHRRRTGAPPQL